MSAEERLTIDGTVFDELVALGVDVHIERMSDHSLFIGIYRHGDTAGRDPVFHGFVNLERRKHHRARLEVSVNETTLADTGKTLP